MKLTKFAAATAAASLAISPVVAQAQPAVAPAADANDLGGFGGSAAFTQIAVLALVAAAIIGGILIFNDDDDDDSVSI